MGGERWRRERGEEGGKRKNGERSGWEERGRGQRRGIAHGWSEEEEWRGDIGVSGMGGNEVQRKMGGEGNDSGGSEKSVWTLHRVKMTSGGGAGGQERGQVIFQSDILGTRTHGYGLLHLRWKQL